MKQAFLAFALILLAAPAFAVTFKVTDIRLDGLQRVSASPVFAALPIRVGDTVDNEDVRETVRSIFRTGFFSNIQIARDGGLLIIILQERPAIKKVEIDGNKAIKTEQLTEILDDNGLSEGEILQRQTLQGIARELERQYISQARYGAEVETIIEDLPNNMVNIKIEVDEGSAARIKHINIVGNSTFSDKTLLDVFELSTPKWNSFFTGVDKYAKEKFTGDLESLESFYLNRGYLDFNVLSTQVSISPDRKGVYITINVSEGDIYKIKSLDLAGDPILPEESLMRLILFKPGDTFSQERMTSTSEYIQTLLGNSGYTNAKVEGIPAKNTDDKTVDLSFFVDPGKRVYVRRVEFRGNTKTSDNVLRREMRQLESASASNARIDASKVRLERLGYFKEVNVETKPVAGRADMVDVEYTVEEQPSGSISASIGYAERTKFNLGVSVQQENWLGTGKSVGFGVQKNIYITSYNFSYNDPYFTPDGVSRGFQAFYQTRDLERLFISRISTDSFGFDLNFGYPISEISHLRFGAGYTHQQLKTGRFISREIKASPFILDGTNSVYVTQQDYETLLNLGDAGVPVVDGQFQEFQLQTRALTDDVLLDVEQGFVDRYGTEFGNVNMNLSWARSTLNRGILPTRGNRESVRFEATVPGSKLEYYKVSFDAQAFMPLTRHLTMRLKSRLGYGNGYNSLDILPFFENYYAGGIGSVRGFERFTLGPKGTPSSNYLRTYTGWQDLNNNGAPDPGEYNDTIRGQFNPNFYSAYVLCDNPTSSIVGGGRTCEPGRLIADSPRIRNDQLTNTGGNVLVEFSSEILLPIPFIEDTRSMQLVAFVDAGNVFSTECGELQQNCSNFDMNKLSTSVGLGFTWISGFGPMTFTFAKPINKNPLDETKVGMDFTFGAGF